MKKVYYFINSQQSSILIDLSNTLSALKNIIALSTNTDVDEYNIVYLKMQIKNCDDKPLYQMFGQDKNPMIFFKRKDPISKTTQQIDIKKVILTKLVLSNYPSRQELFMLIDKFLDERKLPKAYQTDIKGASLVIMFEDGDVTFRFMKFLNNYKLTNSLYTNLQTKMVNDETSINHRSQIYRQNTLSPQKVKLTSIVRTQVRKNPYYTDDESARKEVVDVKSRKMTTKNNMLRFSLRSLDQSIPNIIKSITAASSVSKKGKKHDIEH